MEVSVLSHSAHRLSQTSQHATAAKCRFRRTAGGKRFDDLAAIAEKLPGRAFASQVDLLRFHNCTLLSRLPFRPADSFTNIVCCKLTGGCQTRVSGRHLENERQHGQGCSCLRRRLIRWKTESQGLDARWNSQFTIVL